MYLSTDSPQTIDSRSSAVVSERCFTIPDLRLLRSFERAIRRLNEEIPAERYTSALDSQTKLLRVAHVHLTPCHRTENLAVIASDLTAILAALSTTDEA